MSLYKPVISRDIKCGMGQATAKVIFSKNAHLIQHTRFDEKIQTERGVTGL
jgi:hypothetical protein